jgi:hypothetical protein
MAYLPLWRAPWCGGRWAEAERHRVTPRCDRVKHAECHASAKTTDDRGEAVVPLQPEVLDGMISLLHRYPDLVS